MNVKKQAQIEGFRPPYGVKYPENKPFNRAVSSVYTITIQIVKNATT